MKPKSKEKESAGNTPAFFKHIGAVRCTLWENKVGERTFFNINLVRRFRDGEEWRDSSTLNGIGDALAAIEELRQCVEFIHRREAELNAEDFDGENER